MNEIPRMANMTELIRTPRELIGSLGNGPVVITSDARPTAVLVSPGEWNRIASRLARLERIIAGDKAIAANDWVDSSDVDATFKAMGIG